MRCTGSGPVRPSSTLGSLDPNLVVLLFGGLARGLSLAAFSLPGECAYRGTSLTRKRTPLGHYRRPMPGVLGGSQGGRRFLMGEVQALLADMDTQFKDTH